jgi:hypothetical protein
MAVTYVGTSSTQSSTSSTSHTIDVPTGTTTGDIVVLFLFCDSSSNDPSFGVPAGFTLIARAGNSASDAHAAMYWKAWASGETSYTATQVTSHDFVVDIISLRGCNTSSAVIDFSSNVPGNASSFSWPNGDTVAIQAGSFWLGMFSFDGGDTASLPIASGTTLDFQSRSRTGLAATNLTWWRGGDTRVLAGSMSTVNLDWGGSPIDGIAVVAAMFQPGTPGPSFSRDGVAGASISTVSGVASASIAAVDGKAA